MYRDRFLKRLFMFAILSIFAMPMILKGLSNINPLNPVAQFAGEKPQGPTLSAQRQEHILHGDATGGGHMHGMNRPCKSEFPVNWSEQDIISTITAEAANDNLPWQQQANGNYVADAVDHGVKIRLVLSSDRTQIITAYPLDRARNPCPHPANDNQ